MACPSRTCLPSILATAATREEVAAKARELGVVRRSRKVEAYGLLMAVVLGLSVRGSTVLSRLHRAWCRLTGQRLARSAFWDRLTPPFMQLVKWLLDRLVTQSRECAVSPPGRLSQFRDVLALDSSVVQVHKSLRDRWPGTRTNSAPAAIKVHALVRVFTGELVDDRLTGERVADCKAFGVSHRLSRCLVLLDQGYSSPICDRISRECSVGDPHTAPANDVSVHQRLGLASAQRRRSWSSASLAGGGRRRRSAACA